MNTELYTLLDYAFGQAGFAVTGEMHSGLLVSHRSTRYAVPKLKKTECSKRYFAQDGSYSQEYTFTASVTCFGAVCGYSDGQTMLTAIRTALELLNGENGCTLFSCDTEELTRDNATGRLTCRVLITVKGYQSYEGWQE